MKKNEEALDNFKCQYEWGLIDVEGYSSVLYFNSSLIMFYYPKQY